MNIYKHILQQNISKLLNLYDTDTLSKTYGYGDREYWGWKTKDFANATFQGGVHALAIAIKLGLFDKRQIPTVLHIIDAAIKAVERIRDKNGSVSEAYPGENSFCVTALVAFDILSATRHLENSIDTATKQHYLDIVEPLITFIGKNDEVHAVISNHLATGAAAVALWNRLTGDSNPRDNELLDVIYKHQSHEGWYREYEGADPGYQTLCTYYLSCAYEITKDRRLLASLKRSAEFLSCFVHPDGTIGGLYGSRNTEVFYPAGIVALSNVIEKFAMMAKYLQPKGQHLLPQDIDMGNYIPLINAYAVAALHYDNVKEAIRTVRAVPFYLQNNETMFREAGIYLVSNDTYVAIVNYKKGGTLKVFDKQTQHLDSEDGGVFGILKDGTKFSTQQYDDTVDFEDKTIRTTFYKINESMPTPMHFLLLRIMSMTIFRSIFLGNMFKKHIVRMLMTGKNKIGGSITRKFQFLADKIIVSEEIDAPKHCKTLRHYGKTKAIHMASSGYFLPQHYGHRETTLVEFKQC